MAAMSRRTFLTAAAGAVAGLGIPDTATAQERPNFLFILADDLGWADLGCYGNTYHESPNIDKLASQGMRFTNAYAACPVCSPTRASLLSGQYPARVGITDFIPGHWRPYEKVRVPVNRTQYLPDEIITFAEVLQGAGYTCGQFGKWHLGDPAMTPGMQGFDEFVVSRGGHFGTTTQPDQGYTKDDYLAEDLTDLGIAFMEKHAKDPFCLYMAHYAVHIPLEARQDLILKYVNKPEQNEEVCNPVYAAMIDHLDQSVGRLLDALDRLGLAENTVVVFYSDNGGLHRMYTGKGPIVTSNAPLRGEKGTLYEGGIREPLIVRWPGHIAPGSTSDAVVTTPDFYPTLTEIGSALTQADYPLDGLSLVPVLESAAPLDRDAVYWHYPHYHHSAPGGAVRSGDWKLIEFYDDGRLELYNLRDDIGETKNLANEMPEKAAELFGKLAAWRDTVGAEMPIPNPDYDPARAPEWGKHPG